MSGGRCELNCLGCGLVCERVFDWDGRNVERIPGIDCSLADRWEARQREAIRLAGGSHRSGAPASADSANSSEPQVSIEGRASSLETARTKVASMLSAARAPLLCGFASLPAEQQRRAVAWGERLGAVVDWTDDDAQVDSIVAYQQGGRIGCTLGEVKNRADLILYYDFDPAVAAPRFAERFVRTDCVWSLTTRRDLRGPRTLAVDDRLPFLLSWIQAAAQQAGGVGGPADGLIDLRADSEFAQFDQALQQARYAVFVVHPSRTGLGRVEGEQLARLVSLLNRHRHVRLLELSGEGNPQGAETVMTWRTGYPCAVRFRSDDGARPVAEFDPHRYRAPAVLCGGEFDLLIVVGRLAVSASDSEIRRALAERPSIAIGEGLFVGGKRIPATVQLRRTSLVEGTVFRCDGVPIYCRWLAEEYPLDWLEDPN